MESRETAFMGKITAGMTHEIRNVLAIIKESAGLMEDILLLGKGDPAQQADRFKRMISKILAQVDRGTTLAAGLNQFAHCPDSRQEMIDMNDLLEHLTLLARRFAGNRLVSLETVRSDKAQVVAGDPLKLQMAVFAAVEAILPLAPAVKTIVLQPKAERDRVWIDVSLEGLAPELTEWHSVIQAGSGWEILEEACRNAGGTLEVSEGTRSLRLMFDDSGRKTLEPNET
jgi:C4-dicarboxylate-specific signal transduction histidine kinase